MSPARTRVLALVLVSSTLLAAGALPASAAPVRSSASAPRALVAAPAATDVAASGTSDRMPTKAWVTNLYRTRIVPALGTRVSWSGSVSSCSMGRESDASRAATLRMVNSMRMLVQLSTVKLDTTASNKAQKAALLMDANGKLSHSPSQSDFPRCWSPAAKEAAGSSNLALGATGSKAIAAYMDEPGDNNTAAGHRRWILNPATTHIATGSTGNANALTVFGLGTSATAARPGWIEWPARGWFPQQIEPDGRWSLSSSNGAVSFDKAAVKVQRVTTDGKVVTTHSVRKHPVATGYGPNTVVFDVSGVAHPTGKAVAYYRVTVTGIRGGGQSSYSYLVRLYDPTA